MYTREVLALSGVILVVYAINCGYSLDEYTLTEFLTRFVIAEIGVVLYVYSML